MIRVFFILLLTVGPAHAWEIGPGPLCEILHEGKEASVRLTYDPAIVEYSIAITLEERWTSGLTFSIRFDGPRGLTIATDRQVISPDGTTLAVADSGFSNVLDGLEFNEIAIATLGDQAVRLNLAGAAPAVRAFRACATGLTA